MHKIAISILNYNNTKDTKDCLDSLTSLSLGDNQLAVYVLDNGSKEKFELINTDSYKKINLEVIRSDVNTGFSGGHNLVYEKAKKDGFDYFLILNNDCIVEKDCFRLLAEKIQGEVAVTVPKIYFTKGHEYHKERYGREQLGKVIWFGGGEFDWDNVVSKHIGLDEVDHGQYDEEKNMDFATGACVLFSKEVLEKTGLFDERFFLYYEDADLSMRIIKAGYKILYVPKAIVWHNNAGSSGSGSNLHDYYLTRNKLLFGMKHAPLKMKVLLIKEALRILIKGREWQKRGIKDYFINNLGKGSY